MAKSEPGPKRRLNQLDFALAGGASGFITRMLCQPLDVLKIRFQLQVEPISRLETSKYHSLLHATRLIVREEGVKALWKGHVPAQLLSVSYGMAQFWTFEKLVEESARFKLSATYTPFLNFTCGAVAGCAATLASFPFDVVRTRLVAQGESQKVYPSVSRAFKSILKEEGFLVLYRGVLPTFLQIAPHGGVMFMSYKIFDGWYRSLTNSQETISLTGSLLAGSLAGLCAKTAVYPLDLAKKRMQIQGFERGRSSAFGEFFKCKGLTDCVIRIYEIEGLGGLYKGLNASLIKALITAALHFSCYEMICNLLRATKDLQ